MEFVLIVILVVAIMAFIAYPLFTAPSEEPTASDGALDALISQRDAAYDAIRDLDFDFQLGKLSQRDYATLRERYKARAALALQQIDAADGDGQLQQADAGARIEEQVAQLRAHAKRGDDIERQVAQLRSSPRCRTCGTPYRTGDQFCGRCGSRLT